MSVRSFDTLDEMREDVICTCLLGSCGVEVAAKVQVTPVSATCNEPLRSSSRTNTGTCMLRMPVIPSSAPSPLFPTDAQEEAGAAS
ncbi:hypothetical protein JZ751_014305 [Albula glossodonta]|uniref:Uncharacterized protein n=1 Tax=Albula glossodonta TaxID=121402 RepID=A0A8T2NT30_9TELE|nr:hypothetical protein JZ751_014305 [Albula glossodonta]